jgi:predicted permease
MDTLVQDIRYGIRQLVRQRGFSLVAVLTLALGIGASTAVFTVIDAAMLHPLPYPNPEQLVRVGVSIERPGSDRPSRPTPSFDDLRLWRASDDVFTEVAGFGSEFSGRIIDGERPERVEVGNITEGYLAMHGVAPALGRDFNVADMQPGAPAVVLISYGYWQRKYGGRPDVLGDIVRYNNGTATIVGVLPGTFADSTPIWRPLAPEPGRESRRGSGRLSVYARLRPDVTIDQAIERLGARMEDEPGPDGTPLAVGATVTSRLASTIGGYQTTVNVLAGAVGLVLLIACVNVAGLLLARGASRTSELAVRGALGAGKLRLIRQMLTESVVLAVAGGAVGVAVAWLALDVLVANIPMRMPSDSPAALNGPVLGASLVLTVATGLIFGLAPAIRLSRVNLSTALARGSRRQGASMSKRGGQALIAAEVALAVVLAMGAGLMIRSFSRLSAVDLGYDPAGIVTMDVMPLAPDITTHAQYYPALLRTLRGMPDVAAAGAVDWFALGGGAAYSSVTVNGEGKGVGVRGVLPGYLEALGLPLESGRFVTPEEYDAGTAGVVLNASAAREVFPNGPAVNQRLTQGGTDYTVVGVVADLLHGGPTGEAEAEAYLPYTATEFRLGRSMTVVVRPAGPAPDLATRLRQAAEAVGPRVLVESVRSGNDWFGDRVITPRRRTVMLGLLGSLGLVLALVGIFGMTAYAVARRTVEIGVRMAFGARPGQVVGAVVRDAAAPVVLGTLAGLGGAVLATKVIASFLFETTPTDPITFAAVAIVLAASGCLAAWLPARRAARIDPVTTLRAE